MRAMRCSLAVLCVLSAVLAVGAGAAGHAGAWHRADLRPVTQPSVVAGRVVVYAEVDRQLRLLALSARTGRTLWSQAASPSYVTPGVAPEVASIDGVVVYLQDAGGARTARLAGVDAATGRSRWQTDPGLFGSWPTPCGRGGRSICVNGALAGATIAGLLEFDARTGVLIRSEKGLADGRALGQELVDSGNRAPETLTATSGARVVWERPLRDVFAGKGLSSDWGWNFERYLSRGLYIGSVGADARVTRGSRVTLDLSGGGMAAFAISDGRVRWRNAGSQYACGIVPCPGSARHSTDDPQSEGSPEVGVRVRSSGTAVARLDRPFDDPVFSKDARVVLEGFDPGTGRTVWRAPVRADFLFKLSFAQVGDAVIAVRDARDRLVAVDLRTGATRALPATSAAWCRKPRQYSDLPGWIDPTGKRQTKYVGQDSFAPCTVAGRPRPQPGVVPGFVATFGARVGTTGFWSEPRGVRAAPIAG